MLSYKKFAQTLNEAKGKVPAGETEVKDFTIGKTKVPAKITQKGSKFIVYIDGIKLDEYKSQKEAEKSATEFAELMGK